VVGVLLRRYAAQAAGAVVALWVLKKMLSRR
jgi:hypothetical protein